MMTPLICDGVAIKTAARTTPMLMRVKAGTIMNKWSHADFEEAFKTIAQLPNQ
jgi:hypothetical protein